MNHIISSCNFYSISATWCVKSKKSKEDDADENLPKNGIESLIKASALTTRFIE